MKKYWLLALMGGFMFITSCEDDEDDGSQFIPEHYQGNWQLVVEDAGPDSAYTVGINGMGNFDITIDFEGETGVVSGNVNEQGVVTGSIQQNQLPIGSMDGNLTSSGTGSGQFTIVTATTGTADTAYVWTANKL